MIISNLTVAAIAGESGESSEPLLDEFKRQFKKEYFNVGLVMQSLFTYQGERTIIGNNGFTISTMRFYIKGKVDGKFGYVFQTNFRTFPGILDAKIYYIYNPLFQFGVGQFKVPFSREYLLPVSDLDFTTRSRVVIALAPGRDIGFQISGTIKSSIMSYSAGVFNGNGFNNINDNENFLVAGRLLLQPFGLKVKEGFDFEMGFNVAYSDDESANLLLGYLPGYKGTRFILGTDIHYSINDIYIDGEFIYSSFNPADSEKRYPNGFHLTAGYQLLPETQLLLRWDHLDIDDKSKENSTSNWIVFGLNHKPTSVIKFQLNYTIDIEDSIWKHHQLFLNTQIAI